MKFFKKCRICLEVFEEPFDEHFYKCGGYFASYCKECDKAKSKENYYKDIYRNREKRAQWQRDNSESHKKHQTKYNAKVGSKNRADKEMANIGCVKCRHSIGQHCNVCLLEVGYE